VVQPSSELLPGTLFLLILRTLASGPLHGYAIAKRIKESSKDLLSVEEGSARRWRLHPIDGSSKDLLSVEEGSLYPALNRMLVKGWLAAEWGVSETNRKARF